MRFPFFRPSPCLAAFVTLACLMLFSGTVCAAGKVRTEKKTIISEELTRPTFKTLTVSLCPKNFRKKKEEWEKGEWKVDNCSRARLMYPLYKKTPWLNQLIAQSVILPMFAERLEETPARKGGEALYEGKLANLVRKGGEYGSVENPPVIEFTAKLTGYDKDSLSSERFPRPEIFGSYLQFAFEHELRQQYDARPSGPSGGFIVVDIRTRKILTFDNLILPGREKALENLQRTSFRAWLKTERKLPEKAIWLHLANPSYAFSVNKNWRIAEGGLIFRFATNEVGPRPFGSPEIFVEKDRLQNIIHPDILEQIPGRELTAGN